MNQFRNSKKHPIPQMILTLQTITQDREEQMEQLWKQFQSVLNEYLHQTEEFHNEYVDLRQKDDEDTKIIRYHYAEVVRSTDRIAELKLDLDAYRDEHRIHMNELLHYKKLLQDKQTRIKADMESGLKKDKENMRTMVVCSHETNTVSCNPYRASPFVNCVRALAEITKSFKKRWKHPDDRSDMP